jgi:hypothetical protein
VRIVQALFLFKKKNASNHSEVMSGFSLINLRLRLAFNSVCFLISLTVAERTATGVQGEAIAVYCGAKHYANSSK